MILSEAELAKQAKEAAKALEEEQEALRKARDSSADAAEGFFGLAQAYAEGVTKMELVKRALDTIDEAQRSGLITDEERRASQEKIMLQYGLTTAAAISQARAEEELTRLYNLGKISEEQYLEGLLKIPGAAYDGRVSMDELGGAVADASAKLGEAEDRAYRMAGAIKAIPDRTIKISFDVEPFPNIPSPHEAPIARQHGGRVWPGGAFLVGEAGRELFIPNQAGQVFRSQDTNQMIALLESIVQSLSRP